MKKIGLIVGVAALAMIVGCSTNRTASVGAVGTCEKGKACCKASKEGTTASPGAVSGEKKSGCCATKAAASPGAVSEKKSGCSATSTGCTSQNQQQ
jgi:hypothetical protein